MSEWEAISWVFGGVAAVVGFIVVLKKWRTNDKELIATKALAENETKAYWKKTDANEEEIKKHEEEIEEIRELIKSTNKTVKETAESLKEMQNQRAANVEREVLKNDSVKKLLESHVKEDKSLEVFVKKFKELDYQDRLKK